VQRYRQSEPENAFERAVLWCIQHWPISLSVAVTYCVTEVLLPRWPLPVLWLIFFGVIGGGVVFDLLVWQKRLRGQSQQAAAPAETAPRESRAPQARERWEFGPGGRTGYYRDDLGRAVQVFLPPCAEYYRAEKDPAAFDKVVGLEKAKEALRDAFALALGLTEEARRMREYGVKPPKGILLYGPPGTGKTSFARAAARVFGCGFIVVNASSVAGMYVGQTEENIRQVFRFARANAPCVIFWDEIDAVAKKRGTAGVNSPSDLAINTILTEMDGFQGSEGVIVIAATNRVDQLDEALLRPGRFDVQVEVGLPDREAREKLFRLFLKDRPSAVPPSELGSLARETEGLSPAEIQAAVNEAARQAAKKAVPVTAALVRDALRERAGRGRQVRVRPPGEIWAEIDGLVGLAPVKAFLREVEATVLADKKRREKGLPALKQSMHMCFLGNPGTGKTTVARLVGELLAALGALPSGHLVETDRSGLVAGYVGQTAQKVREVLDRAMGGVLFIDEAYSLSRGGPYDFGAEALDAIIKAMEDHRDKLVMVLAGYTREMQGLFAMNSGLESRIAFTCEFPDYSPEELVEIARLEARKQGFRFGDSVEAALLEMFRQVEREIGELGNGRYARKLVEQAVRKAVLAGRVDTLEPEDFAQS
jgi:SpoVK/Ycf46/Vps4 family AAA+-type ATPase